VTVRRHLLSGDPILFAPGRSERPNAFGTSAADDVCPFCPGHEEQTPPAVATVGEPWRVRVFPNKYPASEQHEVIVEAPDHEAEFEDIADAAAVIGTYRERYAAVSKRAAYAALFKNHGPLAGASLRHIHSQLLATPFLPPRIVREQAAFADGCPLCDALRTNVIDENAGFVRIAPEGSAMSYQQWLVPKQHAPELSTLQSDEDLAAMLQAAAGGMRRLSGSYNWVFVNFPAAPRAHWYVELFPRFGAVAGFELGTGTFIEVVDPLRAVEALR
jgi:UDPglucose--hexose-1-phosphate uridylyltransferase